MQVALWSNREEPYVIFDDDDGRGVCFTTVHVEIRMTDVSRVSTRRRQVVSTATVQL